MAKKFYIPIRMCISCRERLSQDKLLRFRCQNGDLSKFAGYGRSFYICEKCLCEEKKLAKALMRQCKNPDKDKLTFRLKEIVADE